jgi:putative nucleotidyltransferase with HDIG domain
VASSVLIAENDGDARGLLTGWLEGAGYACVPTEMGAALSEARRKAPDAAIVSVSNASDGGMWIVRALRALSEPVAVVAIATPPSFDVATAVSRLGAIDCLPGPPLAADVIDAVERAVLWRRAVHAVNQQQNRLQEELAFGRQRLQDTIRKVDPGSAQAILLSVLEARSPDTHDHAERVADRAGAIARALDLSPDDVDIVRRAALLHDIGKIAVPERLLASTVPLTDEELAALRSHVTIGRDVLSAVPTLAPVAPVVAATHERFDGTGYPAGSHGDTIPLAARIIAVADAFDALTSARSYHDPVSHDDANAELVRCAGTHFDPDVVRAWMLLDEGSPC